MISVGDVVLYDTYVGVVTESFSDRTAVLAVHTGEDITVSIEECVLICDALNVVKMYKEAICSQVQ